MTDMDTALDAIAKAKREMHERIALLEESDRNADLVITMLVDALKEVRTVGASTALRRHKVRHALEFAAAHLGREDAA